MTFQSSLPVLRGETMRPYKPTHIIWFQSSLPVLRGATATLHGVVMDLFVSILAAGFEGGDLLRFTTICP